MTTLTAPSAILTADQLRRIAPSIFAATPWGAMSDRYRMIPTIEVVGMLADRAFRPVRAAQSRSRIEGKGDFTKHLIRFRHDSYLGAAVGSRSPNSWSPTATTGRRPTGSCPGSSASSARTG